MFGKTIVEIHKGDITKLQVDAIVNAANERMLGGGGVDGAIHKAAGPGLFNECYEIPEISEGCRCPTGEARLTSGHNLLAKYVIHTVAPRFPKGKIEDLARCYENCIKLAEKHNIKTIAFPSLGTGVYSIPMSLACPTALETVKRSLSSTTVIEKVIFVCFSDNDYHFYEKTLSRMD